MLYTAVKIIETLPLYIDAPTTETGQTFTKDCVLAK